MKFSVPYSRGSSARGGFTLIEVLVAAVVLGIALLGIGGAAYQMLHATNKPDQTAIAARLASERLDYFRGQPDPYFAVGGTYYPPPATRDQPDYDNPPDGNNVNIICNKTPQLFVREYLYGLDPKKYQDALTSGNKMDTGQQDLADRILGKDQLSGATNPHYASTYGANVIPPTPIEIVPSGSANPTDQDFITSVRLANGSAAGVDGILPNPDTGAGFNDAQVFNTGGRYTRQFCFVPMPRANDWIRAGSSLPSAIQFVREVWIQTNNANFNTTTPTFPGFAAGTIALGNLGITTSPVPNVDISASLPPYVVAVTVLVYARQTSSVNHGHQVRIDKLAFGAGLDEPDGISTGSAPLAGRAYDPTRPLAEEVGYFALQRAL